MVINIPQNLARTLCTATAAACCAGMAPAFAQDDYPTRPVSLVVGFPPGGSNDIVARVLAPEFAKALGTEVVVENRAGANATIGTEHVVRAKPDGYTITLGSASPLAISPHTYPNLPYDPLKDLACITTVAATPEVVAVNPGVQAKTLPELIALAGQRDVTLGSAGNGGLPHLAIELLKTESEGRFVHVPYKGASPAVTDAAGGHVQGVIMDLPAVLSMIEAGKLRALAVTNTHRASILPDVPTSGEAGLPTVLAFNWFAVMAPAGTPKPILEKLHQALMTAVQSEKAKADLNKLGIEVFTQPSPQACDEFLGQESVRWGKVAQAAGAAAGD